MAGGQHLSHRPSFTLFQLVRELFYLVEHLVELGLCFGLDLLSFFVSLRLLGGLFLGFGIDDDQIGRVVLNKLERMLGTNLDTGAAA